MSSIDEQRLLVKIITYLRSKNQSFGLEDEQKESLEG